jgi:hypothetical protein
VTVEGHSLLMIASDGAPFGPTEVKSFIIHAAERQVALITCALALVGWRSW